MAPDRAGRLAASAAFACDAAYAVPVLARMLNSLDDPSFAVLSDPDHELRGTVLTLLWPEHLDLATMLAALRPPAPHVHNAYTQFLRNMPSRCANECLPDLLDWAKTAVLDPKAPTTGFVFSSDRIENSLIESVIDRTLRSPDTMQYIEILAKIVLRLFEGHDEVRIPDCLQPDEEGQEPVETQRLRRVFCAGPRRGNCSSRTRSAPSGMDDLARLEISLGTAMGWGPSYLSRLSGINYWTAPTLPGHWRRLSSQPRVATSHSSPLTASSQPICFRATIDTQLNWLTTKNTLPGRI